MARDWEAAVSADLAGLIAARPADWLASQLPAVGGAVRVAGRQRGRHDRRAAARAGGREDRHRARGGGAMTDSRLALEGRSLRMVRTGTVVSVGARLGEGAQGVVHEATFGGFPCAVKWYRAVPRPVELRRSIAALAERGRPHRAFIWPIDVVVSDELPGFGYVMPRLEPGFISFAQLLGRTEQPPFRAMITIGRHLVEAFEALHATGLCYRDISFGNLWVDPERGEVAIIDNDNVGLDGGDVFVWGTLRFMAPEVVRRDAFPSSVTDLYSLAVFLFYLFVHGHPLEGIRTEATFSWASAQRESDNELAVRYFGTEPVFVFDPRNDTNRPLPGDPMRTWWPIYPRFFRAVFEEAFTAGLLDATGTARVSEGVWRRALLRLGRLRGGLHLQGLGLLRPR